MSALRTPPPPPSSPARPPHQWDQSITIQRRRRKITVESLGLIIRHCLSQWVFKPFISNRFSDEIFRHRRLDAIIYSCCCFVSRETTHLRIILIKIHGFTLARLQVSGHRIRKYSERVIFLSRSFMFAGVYCDLDGEVYFIEWSLLGWERPRKGGWTFDLTKAEIPC